MSNDKRLTPEERDQQHISHLYADFADQQPSQQTDDAILRLAESQAKTRTATIQVSQRPWRKWQWPASIAASVVFVSVIMYGQFEQFDPKLGQPQSIPADPNSIADQATLDEAAAKQRSELETTGLASQRVRGSQQSTVNQRAPAVPPVLQQDEIESAISEPIKSNYAEQEAQGLAAKAMQDVELDINMAEFQVDSLSSLSPAASSESAAQHAETPLSEFSATSDVGVSGERRNQPQQGASQSSYLLSIANKLSALQQASSPTEQQRQAIASLQNELVDYLLLLQSANSEILVDQKYLQLLTPEQAQRVLNRSR